MSFIPSVLAHEGGGVVETIGPTLTEIVRQNQINFTLATAAILFVLTILAILMSRVNRKVPPVPTPIQSVPAEGSEAGLAQENEGAWWKTAIFACMVLVILANTIYLVSSTLYVNAKSVTGGPVHWHADFEVWDCGREVELVDPIAPSNKVGSPLLHEHNDKEIHVEEAVFDSKDISVGAFFRVVGGELHSDYLQMPTNDGVVERRNGDLCPNGMSGILQVFLYKAGSFEQQILADPENYLMTPEQKVPPGDCIIVEFGPPKDRTDKLCQSYQVVKEKQERGR